MKFFATAVVMLMLSYSAAYSQQKFELSGKVLSSGNKPLAGVNVRLESHTTGGVTDKTGRFTLGRFPEGNYYIIISSVGFETQRVNLSLKSDSSLKIILFPAVVTLSEVTIDGDYHNFRRSNDSRAVEVVTDEFLRKNLSGSLMKTLDRLPGVSAMSIGSGQSKPVIRGMSFNQVIVAENGVKHESQQWGADHGVEVDQFAVERVEVIKGPASLMYGSDAIAGVIDLKQSFVPAPGEAGGDFTLSGQSNNMQAAASIGLYSRKEKWWAKARFTVIDYADYRIPADSVEYYSYYFRLKDRKLRNTAGEEKNGNIALGYISGKLNSTFYINNTSSKSGFFANAHGLEIRNSQIDYDRSDRDIDLPKQQVNHLKMHWQTSWEHAGFTHRMDIAWQHNNRKEFSEAVEHGYMPKPPDSLERRFVKQTWSLAYAVKNRESAAIRLSAGINAEHQHNISDGWGFILPSFKRNTAGAYLLGETKPSAKWLILAGLRMDAGSVLIEEYFDWFLSPAEENNTQMIYKQRAFATSPRFSHLSGSAGFVYKSGSVVVKTNLGNSFRLPLAKELASDGVNYHMYRFEKGNPLLKPETAWQLDAGLEVSRMKWAAEISPFISWFPSYIYLNPTPDYYEGLQVFNYTQADVLRAGGEFHLHYTILRKLKSGAIGEYVWSQQMSGIKKGFGLPFSPPASVLLNLSCEPVLGGVMSDTWVSLDFKMVAAQNNIVPPEKKTPGYNVLNIGAGSTLKAGKQSLEITLRITNLLNRRYLDHTGFYRLIEVPDPGRGFQLSLRMPFNINTKKT
jgi:iron complex outermembrane receptor protein